MLSGLTGLHVSKPHTQPPPTDVPVSGTAHRPPMPGRGPLSLPSPLPSQSHPDSALSPLTRPHRPGPVQASNSPNGMLSPASSQASQPPVIPSSPERACPSSPAHRPPVAPWPKSSPSSRVVPWPTLFLSSRHHHLQALPELAPGSRLVRFTPAGLSHPLRRPVSFQDCRTLAVPRPTGRLHS